MLKAAVVVHRRIVPVLLVLALCGFFAGAAAAQSSKLTEVTLSVPGPRNSVSIPLELAVKIGADRAEGISLRLRYVGGGGVAIQDLESRNADFGVFGLPAAMHHNLKDVRLVALAPIDDLPLYTLMVRANLRGKVARIEDLNGKIIGIHSNSLATKTTSHQVIDLVLRNHKVPTDTVRYVAAGQSWETQSSAFISQSVDASMCDEPFGTRLEMEKLAFPLYSTGNPADARQTPGGGFLRSSLITRRATVAERPEVAERMVRMVRRVLDWIATHDAEQMADALQMAPGIERQSFIAVHRRFPRQYSKDARFSNKQLQETETFFRASTPDNPAVARFAVESMIVDRWAGRAP